MGLIADPILLQEVLCRLERFVLILRGVVAAWLSRPRDAEARARAVRRWKRETWMRWLSVAAGALAGLIALALHSGGAPLIAAVVYTAVGLMMGFVRGEGIKRRGVRHPVQRACPFPFPCSLFPIASTMRPASRPTPWIMADDRACRKCSPTK